MRSAPLPAPDPEPPAASTTPQPISILYFDCMKMRTGGVYTTANFTGVGTVSLYFNGELVASRTSTSETSSSVFKWIDGASEGTCRVETSTGISRTKVAW